MNKNVKKFISDNQQRLGGVEFANGQIISFFYDEADKVKEAVIGNLDKKEEQAAPFETVGAPPSPPPPPSNKPVPPPPPRVPPKGVGKKTDEGKEDKSLAKEGGDSKPKAMAQTPTPAPSLPTAQTPPLPTPSDEPPSTPPPTSEPAGKEVVPTEPQTSGEGKTGQRSCKTCNQPISATAAFCGHCGTKQ